MKGFRRLFSFLHKNVNLVIIFNIRYIDVDTPDIDEINKEATMANTAAPVQTPTTTWNIDPAHSIAEFKVKHMMIANVKGQFPKVSGALFLDESDLANSRVEATIEAASIHTRDDQRDAHLKSADFFDAEKFPSLHFKSAGISVVRDGELSVVGDLTIHGVTRGVSFTV